MLEELTGRGSKEFILTGLAPPSHPEDSTSTERIRSSSVCMGTSDPAHIVKEGNEKMGGSTKT